MKVRYYVNKDYEERLHSLVESIADRGVPVEADCVFSGRNRIYRLDYDGLKLSIKAFRKPSFPNKFVYTNIRKSKARRSFENAEEMLRRDIPTPLPLAWIEKKKCGSLAESYYICEHSPYEHNLRFWETWDEVERDDVLQAYAKLLLKIHNKGIQHHDLSPGNVLWMKNAATGVIEFQIVDLNRMTLKNRPLTEKEAYGNFRNINLVETETRRLGAIYGKERGIEQAASGDRAVQVLKADQKRKQRLHKIKRIFQPK